MPTKTSKGLWRSLRTAPITGEDQFQATCRSPNDSYQYYSKIYLITWKNMAGMKI